MAVPQPRETPESQWFWDHYEWAAREIIDFLEAAGKPIAGRRVVDVGCGDGIMAVGVARAGHTMELVGYDVNPVDQDSLLARCRAEGVTGRLPAEMRFERSGPAKLPRQTGSVDIAYTWSAFEHVAHPVALLREIRRVLREDGALLLQLWPFYFSDRGSHLWEWFPEPFHHLEQDVADVIDKMRTSDTHSLDFTAHMAAEYQRLNRITLDELQRSIIASGLDIVRVEAVTSPVTLTPDLARYSIADLLLSGVKLVAVPSTMT